jgi:hypothetical protein
MLCHVLFIVRMSAIRQYVVMLSVGKLSVVMLSVVAPIKDPQSKQRPVI